MNDVICVVGMHRSGTSMVARLLHLNGLNLGAPDQLLGADPGNPEGHFEHLGFLEIDDALLSHFGGSLYDPPPLKNGWENDPSLVPIIQQGRRIVETFPQGSPWGWKDPRSTLLLPFWKSLISNLRFIICVRNPLEVAKSLAARQEMPIQKSIYLWNLYTRSALRDTAGRPRMLIFYDDFFQDPQIEIEKLVQFCGLQRPHDSFGVTSIVSQTLRHQRTTFKDLLDEDRIASEVKLFYLCLRALSGREFTKTDSLNGVENVVSDNMMGFLRLIEERQDWEKLTQLHAAVAARDMEIKQLKADNERHRLDVESFRSTLFWKFAVIMDDMKNRWLPVQSRRRDLYDSFLKSLKQRLSR